MYFPEYILKHRVGIGITLVGGALIVGMLFGYLAIKNNQPEQQAPVSTTTPTVPSSILTPAQLNQLQQGMGTSTAQTKPAPLLTPAQLKEVTNKMPSPAVKNSPQTKPAPLLTPAQLSQLQQGM